MDEDELLNRDSDLDRGARNTDSETEFLQVYNILVKEHVAFPSKELFPQKKNGRLSINSINTSPYDHSPIRPPTTNVVKMKRPQSNPGGINSTDGVTFYNTQSLSISPFQMAEPEE